MGSTAITAQGTTLSIDTSVSGGPTYTPVANIKSYSGFDGSAAEIDVTNLDSEAKEFRLGLQDNGQFTLEIDRDFSDAGQTALLVARQTGEKKQFKLLLPNGENAIFTAFVKKFGLGGGVDQVVKSGVDLRISGAVVWSAT